MNKKVLREVKYAYTKQSDLLMLFRIEHRNTRGSLNFRAKGIIIFGGLENKVKMFVL